MKYENNWESLNKRPVPAWFEDAKFGIFIHWGIYSVPAFAPKNNFSEWYWYNLKMEEPTETAQGYIDYHNKVYSEDYRYEDFVKDFTAENFNAGEWAELFEKSGAKYINLVSKHHDGYCMYKSDYAKYWNSVDVGPHRDFCRELKDALDKTDVKFGVYHSIYEWYHPLYLKDPEKYALEHLIPMMKELIEEYKPYTLFTDGEWDHPSEVWHSTDFLQWLYNESSVKDYIVPNDRWGTETRGVYGGNFTTEYGVIDAKTDSPADNRVSEECRGIGGSFGWNKSETPDDYLTSRQLVHLLIDMISHGNNLLLNVGPTADGRIPVIMQERLLDIGKWLKVNGEGVYASRFFTDSSQQDAVKYTKKNNDVFAFLLKFPFKSITLNDIDYKDGIKAEFLCSNSKIECQNDNGKLKLVFEDIDPETMKCEYAYTVKLSNIL